MICLKVFRFFSERGSVALRSFDGNFLDKTPKGGETLRKGIGLRLRGRLFVAFGSQIFQYGFWVHRPQADNRQPLS